MDWGTTRLRASLVRADGTVMAETASDMGMMRAREAGFEPALAAALEGLGEAARARPVLMSGMVGARQGWVEAPYVETPATLEAIAAGCIKVETALVEAWIVPGVCHAKDTRLAAEVMRGEEVEVFGALHLMGRTEGTFVLPGTHTKWAHVEDSAITAFETAMTGDVFHALTTASVLAATAGAPTDPAAFKLGLAAARENLRAPGDLLTGLFRVRTEHLFGRLDDDGAASFLSGLLIGAEVAAKANAADIVIVGSGPLAARYAEAIGPRDHAPPGAAVRGLTLIARARGLLAEPSQR